MAKAAQAQFPIAIIPPPVSDEDRFKSERTAISKNSFERASKQYFLHQQKMLAKEKERKRKKDRDAMIRGRDRFKSSDNSSQEPLKLSDKQKEIVHN